MRYKSSLALLLGVLTIFSADAQITLSQSNQRIKTIFDDDKPKPQVLLLGVFHFEGEKVDASTTPSSLAVNMMTPQRQQQIQQLVKKLADYKPTKIVVEAPPYLEHYLDSIYQAWCKGQPLTGKWPGEASEIVQLGFRLAKLCGNEKLYSVDAQAFRFSLSLADSIMTYEKYKDQQDAGLEYWDKKYDEESAYSDSVRYYLPLNGSLQYLNAPEKQARAIGRWLITTKRGANSEPIGADGFITRYFNRNVRIYSNIQRIVTSKEDRILVIYGATHMYMLKQLFTASPEFELKDIMQYLK